MSNEQPLPVLYPFALYRGDTRVWEHRFYNDPPEWAASTAYVVGVVGSGVYVAGSTVTHLGVTYTCTTAHTSTATFDATMWTADPAAVGAPIDITGWTFASEYRATPDDTVLATEACAITDAANGVMVRTLSAAQASLITTSNKRVAWDLQATKADLTVKTYLYNPSVKLTEDVTHS